MKAYKIENYSNALENYRDAALSKYCIGPIISNYLICELKYGKPSIAREYIEDVYKRQDLFHYILILFHCLLILN